MNIFKKLCTNTSNNLSRILLRNVFLSYFLKGFSIIISFISTPAYLAFFEEKTVYGVWFSIVSFVNMILIFDFGLGNGLRNELVVTLKAKNYEKAKTLISSTYVSTAGIALVFAIVAVFFVQGLDLNHWLNVDASMISPELLKSVVLITILGILVHFIVKTVSSIYYALQQTYVPGILSMCNSLILLIFLLSGRTGDLACDLLTLAIVQAIASIVPELVATVLLFSRQLRCCRPSFKSIKIGRSLNVIKLGVQFFSIQMFLMVIRNTNEILINYYYGGEATAEYTVYHKLLFLAVNLFSLVSQPLWSSFSVAFTEKRLDWIHKTYKKCWLFLLLVTAGNGLVALVIQIKPLMELWLKDEAIYIQPLNAFVFWLVAAMVMMIAMTTSLANGANKLKPQLIGYGIGIVLKLAVSVLLAQHFDNWIVVMVAELIALFPVVLIQPIDNMKLLKAQKYK